jgi:hypothetical protein
MFLPDKVDKRSCPPQLKPKDKKRGGVGFWSVGFRGLEDTEKREDWVPVVFEC